MINYTKLYHWLIKKRKKKYSKEICSKIKSTIKKNKIIRYLRLCLNLKE